MANTCNAVVFLRFPLTLSRYAVVLGRVPLAFTCNAVFLCVPYGVHVFLLLMCEVGRDYSRVFLNQCEMEVFLWVIKSERDCIL